MPMERLIFSILVGYNLILILTTDEKKLVFIHTISMTLLKVHCTLGVNTNTVVNISDMKNKLEFSLRPDVFA